MNLTTLVFVRHEPVNEIPPPQYLPSIIDIERCPPMDMWLPVQDGCPKCGAFRMCVGDYVYAGVCDICHDIAIGELGE